MSGDIPYTSETTSTARVSNLLSKNISNGQHKVIGRFPSSIISLSSDSSSHGKSKTVQFEIKPSKSSNQFNTSSNNHKIKDRSRSRNKKKKNSKSREHSLENQLSVLSSIVQPINESNRFLSFSIDETSDTKPMNNKQFQPFTKFDNLSSKDEDLNSKNRLFEKEMYSTTYDVR